MVYGKFLSLSLALVALSLPSFAVAKEVSEISQAQAQDPSCSNPTQYKEKATDMIMKASAPFMAATCEQCKAAIKQAVEGANGKLAAAKGQDQSINASTSASTGAKAAATGAMQKDTEFKNAGVNNDGGSALTQQQGLAQGVAADMNGCAQKINSACSGGLAQEDKAAADQSAQSCQKSAGEAQQVAGEKGAKAGEMAKNEAKSNDNGQKLGEMPQMPQMGQGGDKGGASNPNSSLSGDTGLATEKAAEQKLEGSKLANSGTSSMAFGGMPEDKTAVDEKLELVNGAEQVAPTTGISEGHSSSGASRSLSSATGSGGGGGASGGVGVSAGSSGASSFGGSGSGTNGSDPGSAAAMGTGAGTSSAAGGEGMGVITSSSGGSSTYVPLKSAVLGLATDGEELKDFVATKGGAEGSSNGAVARNGVLHDRQGGLTKAINEQSLFHRISFRLRRISADRTMQ